jgi:hypothetical protein
MDRDDRVEAGPMGHSGEGGEAADPPKAGDPIETLQRLRPNTRSRVRSSALPVLVAAALVIAVCAGVLESGVLRGPAAQTSGGGADVLRPTGLIGCFGMGPGFSPDQLLSGSRSAETMAGAPASALRAFLAGNPDMPASGWTMVSGSGATVMYLAPVANDPINNFVEVTFEPGTPGPGAFGADGWRTSGYGSCRLMAVPPAGYSPATWALDPGTPYVPGATELHVLVDEMGCHGFQTAEGRIVQNVDYRADAVVVTLAVLAREGFQNCPGTPPTPYVLHLTQPVGTRNLTDGTPWPPTLISTAGRPFYTPSPTPYPSNWHMPMDCTGEADGPGSFKAVAMMAKFEVFCAALPAGWQRTAMSDFTQVVTSVTVTYRGPNGETFELTEGDFCTESAAACAPGVTLGFASFGGLKGQLVSGPPDADFALYVAPGMSPSWKATGSGMTRGTFEALATALIVVGSW